MRDLRHVTLLSTYDTYFDVESINRISSSQNATLFQRNIDVVLNMTYLLRHTFKLTLKCVYVKKNYVEYQLKIRCCIT